MAEREGSRQERLWNSASRPDSQREMQDVLQARERSSAEAAIRGRRWDAKVLLQSQMFANNQEASRYLIQSSRKLIADSRQLIRLGTSNAAFARRPRKKVN